MEQLLHAGFHISAQVVAAERCRSAAQHDALPLSPCPAGYDVTIPGELFQRKLGAATGLGPFETKFQATFVAQRSEAFEQERRRRQEEYNAMLARNHKHKTDGRDDARSQLRVKAAQRVAENQASGVYFARTRLKQEQERLREVPAHCPATMLISS